MMNGQKPYDEHIEGIDKLIIIRLLPNIAFDIIGYKPNHTLHLMTVAAVNIIFIIRYFSHYKLLRKYYITTHI